MGATLEGPREDARRAPRAGESLRGIGDELATRIVAGAPWREPEDLVRRAGCQQHHLEVLAAAGALDSLRARAAARSTWAAGAAAQGTPGPPRRAW